MSKIAVVFWTGTGNTSTMATAVVEGIKEAGAEAELISAADFGAAKVKEFDGIAFGCPAMGAEVLEEMEMEPFGNRYPKELSYGQQQRIAIARALAYPSPLLLMDEPFKGLDEALSHRIIERIREKQMKEERIILFTSHNPDEIRLLADEVIYL